jgi:hypothetical protein
VAWSPEPFGELIVTKPQVHEESGGPFMDVLSPYPLVRIQRVKGVIEEERGCPRTLLKIEYRRPGVGGLQGEAFDPARQRV